MAGREPMKTEVYAFGEKVESLSDYSRFRPTIDAPALTHDLAKEQGYVKRAYFGGAVLANKLILPKAAGCLSAIF